MHKHTSQSNLRNNLNDLDLSEEEFEQLRTDYEQKSRSREYSGKSARFAKIAGLIFLLIASFYVVQQFYFPFGPDISNVIRLIPSTGTILVLVIGLGLFTRYRRRKYPKGEQKKKDIREGEENRRWESDDDTWDPYAFQTHKKWWRSRKERMLAGVCGGIAERYQWDPTIVRALFALAFFSYGFSLVVYIVLAVVLPVKPLKAA